MLFHGTNMAKAAVTTVLAPSASGVTVVLYSRIVKKRYDLPMVLNGILAGLVSITAGCVAVADGSALAIGVIGAFVYLGAAALLERFQIDDPLGAIPVHGACGIWGVWAVGIFANSAASADSYGAGLNRSAQFGMQFVAPFIIIAWSGAFSAALFTGLKKLKVLRVPEEDEKVGLDVSEHGGAQILHF